MAAFCVSFSVRSRVDQDESAAADDRQGSRRAPGHRYAIPLPELSARMELEQCARFRPLSFVEFAVSELFRGSSRCTQRRCCFGQQTRASCRRRAPPRAMPCSIRVRTRFAIWLLSDWHSLLSFALRSSCCSVALFPPVGARVARLICLFLITTWAMFCQHTKHWVRFVLLRCSGR